MSHRTKMLFPLRNGSLNTAHGLEICYLFVMFNC